MNYLSLITKEEWAILEDLNLDIYDTPITQILPRTLEKCRALIDYSHSLTYLIRYENGQQTSFQYESPDIPQQYLRLYVEKFIMTDYINWYTRSPKTSVFRESDIVPDSIRLNSEFMADWMMPIGLYHGAGMIVSRSGIKYAGLFLYRNEGEPNFSDRDMQILRVIHERLSHKFHNHFPSGLPTEGLNPSSANIITIDARLTAREKEILSCIDSGILRSHMAEHLCITENTLNKHLANIYRKLGVNSFEHLIQIIKAHSTDA